MSNIVDMRAWVRRKVLENPRAPRSALGLEKEYEVEAVLTLFGPPTGGLHDPKNRKSVEKYSKVGLQLADKGDYLGAAYCAMCLLGARQADRATQFFVDVVTNARRDRRRRVHLTFLFAGVALVAFAAGHAGLFGN